jgi:hypothetical protein
MASWRMAATVLLVLGSVTAAGAQQPPPRPEGAVDVDRLPINLSRIQRELKQSSERADQDGLNLRFQVEVFGQAPQIQLFTPADNLTTGPVPYGAPTHQQMLQMMTPKEFSAPVMDFNALFRWLAAKPR